MGYSGSIYQKLGNAPATSVFIERKGDGESCLVYPEIYHFNKKTEVTNKTITETVDMLNYSSSSYHDLAYDMKRIYELIYSLGSFFGMTYKEVFDENENFLLIPRIESSDSCGNSELVSFYEKSTLEKEDIVEKLPAIMERRHQGLNTDEQLASAKRYSCCQIQYMQIYGALSEVCNRDEIDKIWEDVVNIKTKCDILKLINHMHKYLATLNEKYNEKYELAKTITNLLYHYRNRIKDGKKVFVSYCNEIICFSCEGEDDVSFKMPYEKSHLFTMLFGHWAGSGAELSTKEELKNFVSVFKYIPKRKKNSHIENYFKNFLANVSDDNLYNGETFTISIGGGY